MKAIHRIMLISIVLVLAGPHLARTAETKGILASKIIDQVVKNQKGQDIGDVDDLIISRNGKIKKAILDVGGFLGIGEKLVEVPFRYMKISQSGEIFYPATQEQLEKLPRYSYREAGLEGWYVEMKSPYPYYPPEQEYYGHLYYPRAYPEPYAYPGGMYPRPYPRYYYWAPGNWFFFPDRMRVSVILGHNVVNDRGEPIGEIEDLVIGPKGEAIQTILSIGGFLGVDEKYVAVPFERLKTTTLGIAYNYSRKELMRLPKWTHSGK
jgi:sporulation protein YlmC with PRC-barrel domain